MRLCQDPRFSADGGLPAWPPRGVSASSNGRNTAPSTARNGACGARLADVSIVRPYTISRHLMLTLSDRFTSWKVPLRLDHPAQVPALHEFLLANVGRTIAEIGELELHP